MIDRKTPAKAALLTAEHRSALAQAVEDGPVPRRDGVVRRRLVDLAAWLWEEFGIAASRQTLGRELRRMEYRSLSARPQAHGQDPEGDGSVQTNSPAAVAEIRGRHAHGTRMEAVCRCRGTSCARAVR